MTYVDGPEWRTGYDRLCIKNANYHEKRGYL